MQMFLTSDVIYTERVVPLIENTLRDADVGAQRLPESPSLPGIEWLQPAPVADALGQQLSAADERRQPAPGRGLHGNGIDPGRRPDARADAAHRIATAPDGHRQLHQPGRERTRSTSADQGRGPAPIRVPNRRLGRRRRPDGRAARSRARPPTPP